MTDLPDEQPVAPLTPAPPQVSPQTTSVLKEREVLPEVSPGERVPVVEIGRLRETEAEREGYLERLEKEVELQKPVTDDYGQVLVTSAAAQQPKIILPMDRTTYLNPKNWHKPVTEAIRWLLEWAKRIVKMHPKQVVFEE